MNRVAELALVLDQVFQPVEIAAGAVLDQRPPQIDKLFRRRRRRQAGELFAHQHRQRILDRRIGACADLIEFAAVIAVVEHGRDVAGDALHAARADRFDARLLDRLEHGASLLAARLLAAMDRRIVAGEPQRDRIRVAAHDRGFRFGQLARRLRQPRLAAGEAGPLGRKRDFEIGLARNGAHAAGDRALERLGRRFPARRFGFAVGGHGHLYDSATFTEDSGSSTPKQR